MPSTKLPTNTPFEKLPSIFKNWNKQHYTLQLTKKQLLELNKNKLITIPIKFYFPNKHNNYLANKMNLNLNITAYNHDNNKDFVPTADNGGDMGEAPEGINTHFECTICGSLVFI